LNDRQSKYPEGAHRRFPRRAVITGIGVVAPNGVGTSAWWQATRAGKSGLRRVDDRRQIEHLDTPRLHGSVAGEIVDFEPTNFVDARIAGQTDRSTQLALAAAALALQDAALDPASLDPGTAGVVTANTMGGAEFTQREMQNLWAKGPIFVGAYQAIAGFYAAPTGQIAIKYGLTGHAGVAMAECAGGLEAIWQATRAILDGVGDRLPVGPMEAMVCGGIEAPLSPYALACQWRQGNMSMESDPRSAYRPFDERAKGYVPGEGGAMLVLEEYASARRRGAPHIYGEIGGYAATSDSYDSTHPEPTGQYLARAISLALDRAAVPREEVSLILADAFGTRERDAIEARAINTALPERGYMVPVTAPKTMTGRLYAGGAPVDVATACCAMRDGCIPPTINVSRIADDCRLNLVLKDESYHPDIGTALILARGFGGFNSALVLKRVE
jgi:act minimal PKS chain-length factor (CLF/KS beta)